MGFKRKDLIPTNLRLAAANRGPIHVAGRTPITVLQIHGRTGPVDELPGSRKLGRQRPIHLGP